MYIFLAHHQLFNKHFFGNFFAPDHRGILFNTISRRIIRVDIRPYSCHLIALVSDFWPEVTPITMNASTKDKQILFCSIFISLTWFSILLGYLVKIYQGCHSILTIVTAAMCLVGLISSLATIWLDVFSMYYKMRKQRLGKLSPPSFYVWTSQLRIFGIRTPTSAWREPESRPARFQKAFKRVPKALMGVTRRSQETYKSRVPPCY